MDHDFEERIPRNVMNCCYIALVLLSFTVMAFLRDSHAMNLTKYPWGLGGREEEGIGCRGQIASDRCIDGI